MRTALMLIIGLAFGAAATAVGLWLGSGDRPVDGTVEEAATTTTTTLAAVVEPVWEEAGETRIGSTLIIPGELSVSEDGEARLSYELRSLAQPYPSTFGPYPAALPAAWELTLVSGATIAGATDPPGRPQALAEGTPPLRDSVAFELPAGSTGDDIATVEVVEWRLAAPIDVPVTIPSIPGSSFTMIDGSVVTLATVLEQNNGTIFDFDVERTVDPWRTEADQGFFGGDQTFQPIGDGWSSSSFNLGAGFQLTWQGETAPPEISLLVATTEWVPVLGARTVTPAVIDG